MNLGTPLKSGATRLMLLGSGELGKEVAIEAQRLGVELQFVVHPSTPAIVTADANRVKQVPTHRVLPVPAPCTCSLPFCRRPSPCNFRSPSSDV